MLARAQELSVTLRFLWTVTRIFDTQRGYFWSPIFMVSVTILDLIVLVCISNKLDIYPLFMCQCSDSAEVPSAFSVELLQPVKSFKSVFDSTWSRLSLSFFFAFDFSLLLTASSSTTYPFLFDIFRWSYPLLFSRPPQPICAVLARRCQSMIRTAMMRMEHAVCRQQVLPVRIPSKT